MDIGVKSYMVLVHTSQITKSRYGWRESFRDGVQSMPPLWIFVNNTDVFHIDVMQNQAIWMLLVHKDKHSGKGIF
jgi:hypothetical protein